MCLYIFCGYTKKPNANNNIKKRSFACFFFGRIIPTNVPKLESCAFRHVHVRCSKCTSPSGNSSHFKLHVSFKAKICSTFHVFVIVASETSLQPQRGLNPCQMLLCYQLLCSLERSCLFSFSDSLLLPNIISFQHRCKRSNDWNDCTALTLSRDGYQFNYGQLKMIAESPALDIYHHYKLLTKLWSEHFPDVPFALGRHCDLCGACVFSHL